MTIIWNVASRKTGKGRGHIIEDIFSIVQTSHITLRCRNKIPNHREKILNKSQLMVEEVRSPPPKIPYPNIFVPYTNLPNSVIALIRNRE